MNSPVVTQVFVLLCLLLVQETMAQQFQYPQVYRNESALDTYFGRAKDPYSWVEDNYSEMTRELINEHNAITEQYLNTTAALQIRRANYGSGNRYFWRSVPSWDLSHNGKLKVVRKSGTFRVVRVSSGEYLSDEISYYDPIVHWLKDDSGFVYTASAEPGNHSLSFHTLGTNQSSDSHTILFRDDMKHAFAHFDHFIPECGNYLIVNCMLGYNYTLSIVDLDALNGTIPDVLPSATFLMGNDYYSYQFCKGTNITFFSHYGNNKLVQIDVANPERENWITVVDEEPDRKLKNAHYVDGDDKMVLRYTGSVDIFEVSTGERRRVKTPGYGVVNSWSSIENADVFIEVNTILKGGVVYRCNLRSGVECNLTLYSQPGNGLDITLYELKEEFYNHTNGKTYRMTIAQKKDIVMDGNNTALIQFRMMTFLRLRNGLIHNLGGIFVDIDGPTHQDSFKSAAEKLLRLNYTNPKKLAIRGFNRHGRMVASAMNENPQLFAAGIPIYGHLDSLIRAHWNRHYPTWEGPVEYINDNLQNSPRQNIPLVRGDGTNATQYPATFVIAARWTFPFHSSLKFATQLQHVYGNLTIQTNPLLLKIVGWTQNTGTFDIELLIFLQRALGLEWTD